MYYTIYKITNNLDGKIYIGKHQTKDINDKYMGSGKRLKYAIKKYGLNHFTKEILFVFNTEEQMNAKEAELVTEEFCAHKDTYNICIGGKGGFGYINSIVTKEQRHLRRQKATITARERYGPNWNQFSDQTKAKLQEYLQKCRNKEIIHSSPQYGNQFSAKSVIDTLTDKQYAKIKDAAVDLKCSGSNILRMLKTGRFQYVPKLS